MPWHLISSVAHSPPCILHNLQQCPIRGKSGAVPGLCRSLGFRSNKFFK